MCRILIKHKHNVVIHRSVNSHIKTNCLWHSSIKIILVGGDFLLGSEIYENHPMCGTNSLIG